MTNSLILVGDAKSLKKKNTLKVITLPGVSLSGPIKDNNDNKNKIM